MAYALSTCVKRPCDECPRLRRLRSYDADHQLGEHGLGHEVRMACRSDVMTASVVDHWAHLVLANGGYLDGEASGAVIYLRSPLARFPNDSTLPSAAP
jgi:hypothetical protein